MKIDVHTHTRRCKKGDPPGREISARDCCDKILQTDVKIFAITNHNLFDIEQFLEIHAGLEDNVQVWPGIELDILDTAGSRGHLLVVVSPNVAEEFSSKVAELLGGIEPDNFETTIDDVVSHLDPLGPIYIAHYRQKKPNLSDQALDVLERSTRHPARVIKEVTNSISAGIYVAHGHPSIYGSDVHDWARYEELARDLPDLRLPVDSFEHFCLLLQKDQTTINTTLNKKVKEELVLAPFGGSEFLKLTVFNDINVIFGPKGTGKSCILKAIADYYSDNGIEAAVYLPAADILDEIFDVKGKTLNVDLDVFGVDGCSREIESLRNASEEDVTSLSQYVAHFSSTITNRNARRILIKDFDLEDDGAPRREFERLHTSVTKTAEFLGFLENDESIRGELNPGERADVIRILAELVTRLQAARWAKYTSWKEAVLINGAVRVFRSEIERKTGSPAKPTDTGFKDYAQNRVAIERNAAKILRNLNVNIPAERERVGNLGDEKGELEFVTEFVIQDGSVADGSYSPLAAVKKTGQKKFAKAIREIVAGAYRSSLFPAIAELSRADEVERIESVGDMLLFKRYFALGGKRYVPSSGEASMVMLHKELSEDKEIYILDEPERSLGNEYISDVIVPMIKDRARANRRIFISTHDANIAVRTLPYSSIYRCYGPSGYSTFVGNPFSSDLVNVEDQDDRRDWKAVSMSTLEGGRDAFGERGRIYGNL